MKDSVFCQRKYSSFVVIVCGCLLMGCQPPRSTNELTVTALPIDANIEGDVMEGPSVLNDPNRFVWGGSVIKGEDGKYHMLYSTWESGDTVPPFVDSWVLRSKIAYAVSDQPDRNYEFQEIVLRGREAEGDSTAWDAVMVHNPHIQRFEGKYYLYYTGSYDPGVQPVGSKGEGVNKRNRVQQSQSIGVIAFDSFEDLMDGRFDRPDQPLLTARTRVKPDQIVNPSAKGTTPKPDNIIVTNPSVVRRPSDGKYLLYFKGNWYTPQWKGIHGVAIGDSPVGPFRAMDDLVFNIQDEDGQVASGEDPYVWYHQDHQRFYAVLKDFTGRITDGDPGLAILQSPDGLQWSKPRNPFFMKKQVVLQSGDTLKVERLERPQILVNETGQPSVLFAACALTSPRPKTDGSTFNVHIPLEVID